MLDELAATVATGAAGNIIAYMLSGQVDALRAQVARIFRHGTEQDQAIAMRALDDDAAALAQPGTSESAVTERWTGLLLSYLAAHPEARSDVEALASSSVSGGVQNIGSQHNHGSGTFIGGDNYGSITVSRQR